jgi:hypothetical protein
MSVCSNATSIMLNGDEMDLSDAIDQVFKGLQSHLNDSQSSLRQLAILSEQDGDFKVAVELSDEINLDIDGMMALFKDLKSVCKQIVGKPISDEEKNWMKQHIEYLKQQKINMKSKMDMDTKE